MNSAGQPWVDGARLGPSETKEQLRRVIRSERERLSTRQHARAAAGFAQVVGDLPQVRGADVVAAYVARPSEPGTIPLLERLARRGTRVLLPVLGTGLQRDWAWFTTAEELQVRAPGRPPEPPGPTLGAEAVAQAGAVVAPALAVDTSGVRLGQGGGWYDRVLMHCTPGTSVIAMVFETEVYDATERPLPHEGHDLRVDVITTPQRWRRVGGTATSA
ncbi:MULTISPECIES: 5-formyltetrahydrofolate cyclo-ligase [unclassified Actinotalea]|uniref:5-formyltetrahydrofolate cyclo-ligase n=1 Tax=unclassified Actinotalea TaxID=2638618 RepID=UPI0015F48F23|nr:MULTISPECIES: 5-formyltetrahydrofolate cyclo-ligase [unclassified Actinotalea]